MPASAALLQFQEFPLANSRLLPYPKGKNEKGGSDAVRKS